MAYADPADALQAGIYTLLSTDSALSTLGAETYDGVPENVEPPYITVGEMLSGPDGAHGSYGRQTSCVIHTWTRAESHRPGNQIGARIAALLSRQEEGLDPLVAGHKVWMVAHEFAQTLVDPEPGIRHRIDRFRIWTRQEA